MLSPDCASIPPEELKIRQQCLTQVIKMLFNPAKDEGKFTPERKQHLIWMLLLNVSRLRETVLCSQVFD